MPLYRWDFSAEIVYDEEKGEIRRPGACFRLSASQQKMLTLLLLAARSSEGGIGVVSRSILLGQAWDKDVADNAIDQAATQLRKFLGEASAGRLKSVRKRGYSFDGRGVEQHVIRDDVTGDTSPLRKGMAVPHAPGFTFQAKLAHPPGGQVWLALGRNGEERVFKLIHDGSRLPALNREMTLHRVLQRGPPDARPQGLARMIECNGSHAPYWLATEPGGQNLLDWAGDHARLKTLPYSRRRQLALQIAEALNELHKAGVLHGDIRPGHILVKEDEGGWRVRWVDISGGQLLDPALLQQRSVTPVSLDRHEPQVWGMVNACYLAPERRDGSGPTPRSEVYGFGGLLYQLLAGDLTKTLDIGWECDVEDAFIREGIIRPARLPDPALRLASMDEVIHRLRNLEARREPWPAGESSIAPPEPKLPTPMPWRTSSAVALSCAVLLVAFLGGWSFLHERSDAQHRQQEEIARTHSQQSAACLKQVLAQGNPVGAGSTVRHTQVQALKKSEAKIDTCLASDPEERANALLVLAQNAFGTSDFEYARGLQLKAIELLKPLGGPSARHSLLLARYGLVLRLDMQGQHANAGTLLDETDKDAGRLLETRSVLTLTARWLRATHSMSLSQPIDAMKWYEEAETVRAEIAPHDTKWIQRLRAGLAWSYERMGRNADAVAALEPLNGPDYAIEKIGLYEWVHNQREYAQALRNTGKLAQAEAILKAVVAQCQQDAPDNYVTGVALFDLASNYKAQGRWREATSGYRKALDIVKQTADEARAAEVQLQMDSVEYLASRKVSTRVIDDLRRERDALVKQGAKTPNAQLASYYLAAALCDGTGGKTAHEAGELIAGLDEKALTAADGGGNWKARVGALFARVLACSGQPEAGRLHMDAANAALDAQGAEDLVFKRVRVSLN